MCQAQKAAAVCSQQLKKTKSDHFGLDLSFFILVYLWTQACRYMYTSGGEHGTSPTVTRCQGLAGTIHICRKKTSPAFARTDSGSSHIRRPQGQPCTSRAHTLFFKRYHGSLGRLHIAQTLLFTRHQGNSGHMHKLFFKRHQGNVV